MKEQTTATKWQGTADLNSPLDVSTEDFIKAFGYSGAENVYCRTFDDSPAKDKSKAANRQAPARSFASMLPELHRLNADRRGIFFAVNGGNTDTETRTINKCRAQFMEIDSLPLEEQLQKIKQFALEPSIIVRTRKSLHTYWLLSEGSIKNFRKVQLQLVAHFGSDPALQNESRVMRLPGFNHCKGEPVPVQVIKFDPGITYKQAELANLLPPPAKPERTELPELTDDSPGLAATAGGRNNGLLKLGGHLRAAGCSAEEITEHLQIANSRFVTPLPEKELNTCIKQALKYNAEELAEQQRLNQAKQDFAQQDAPEKKADFFRDFLQTIQTEAYKPYPTDCAFFDNLLGGGVIRQSLLLLLAAPASGKTTLCQQLAEGMARKGKNVLYFNLEMSAEQMLAKAISCRLTRKDSSQIVSTTQVLQGYQWTAEEKERITKELRYYQEDTAPNITYHSRPSGEKMSLEKIIATLTAAGEKYKAKGEPAPAVFIDYLHLITSERAGTDPAALLKEATDSLKQYAINYNTFVLLICATNRQSNQSGELTLESGRDSSALEYTGDYVLSLQLTAIDADLISPNSKKDKSKLEKLYKEKWRAMTLRVLKHRFGTAQRKADLWYLPAGNIFYDADGFLPVDPERDKVGLLLETLELQKNNPDALGKPEKDTKSARK